MIFDCGVKVYLNKIQIKLPSFFKCTKLIKYIPCVIMITVWNAVQWKITSRSLAKTKIMISVGIVIIPMEKRIMVNIFSRLRNAEVILSFYRFPIGMIFWT